MVSKPEDLYIYLVSGTLTESNETALGGTFMGNWVEGNSAFLFFSAPAENQVAGLLKSRRELRLEDSYHFTYEDWQGGGLDTLKIGPFLVVPPWLETHAAEGYIKILLDPGVVFGNCLHPTTQTCLEALSLLEKRTRMGHVLDLGTGTGILAIAAVLLGAEKTLAVDFNPLCVKTAARNVELNGLGTQVRAVEGKAEDFTEEKADLLVANIQHDVIRDFLEKYTPAKPQTLIISGQMRSQSRDLKTQLKSLGYHTLKEWDHDMTWFTTLAEKA
ncbi:MAG: methyltransferase [Deltaproteobacteria bacterium]|jgi:ribosomal protein L11 methyltransferase|nr:methyltransferase [Deltaproteobacteria bacterium]